MNYFLNRQIFLSKYSPVSQPLPTSSPKGLQIYKQFSISAKLFLKFFFIPHFKPQHPYLQKDSKDTTNLPYFPNNFILE